MKKLATDYSLGIVRGFTASSLWSLPENEWRSLLHERFNLQLYDIQTEDKQITGVLKEEVFTENIEDFYMNFVTMLGDDYVLNWFRNNGTSLDNYDRWGSIIFLKHEGLSIELKMELALLFVQGKVFAEVFTMEPKLMNWLFRHSHIPNKLTGCVWSDIVG